MATPTLTRPWVIVALVTLVANDHVLKARWPGLITGKLSDVAGLVLLPAMLGAAVELTTGRITPRVQWWACAAVAVVFALTKTWVPAAEAYRVIWGVLQWPARATWALFQHDVVPSLARVQLARDPSDLFALPAAFVAWWLLVSAPAASTARPSSRAA